jgi:hypothetical protein
MCHKAEDGRTFLKNSVFRAIKEWIQIREVGLTCSGVWNGMGYVPQSPGDSTALPGGDMDTRCRIGH